MKRHMFLVAMYVVTSVGNLVVFATGGDVDHLLIAGLFMALTVYELLCGKLQRLLDQSAEIRGGRES